MTKLELLDYIESLNCDYFSLTRNVEKPNEKIELTDTRTGGIYPPNPYTKQWLGIPEKLTMEITGHLNQKAK